LWANKAASIVPYKGFKTGDGDILLGGGNDKLFRILCERIGRPEWATDPKFLTNSDRVKNRAELETVIEQVTQTRTTQEWLEIFEGSGMPYAAINDIQTTLNHPHGEYPPDTRPQTDPQQSRPETWWLRSNTQRAGQ
jgi:succinate--hydroxymethylglutarate CoA-transferase